MLGYRSLRWSGWFVHGVRYFLCVKFFLLVTVILLRLFLIRLYPRLHWELQLFFLNLQTFVATGSNKKTFHLLSVLFRIFVCMFLIYRTTHCYAYRVELSCIADRVLTCVSLYSPCSVCWNYSAFCSRGMWIEFNFPLLRDSPREKTGLFLILHDLQIKYFIVY